LALKENGDGMTVVVSSGLAQTRISGFDVSPWPVLTMGDQARYLGDDLPEMKFVVDQPIEDGIGEGQLGDGLVPLVDRQTADDEGDIAKTFQFWPRRNSFQPENRQARGAMNEFGDERGQAAV
jgi:hypothetical protein